MMAAREARLIRSFVRLADTLVDEYDLVELLQWLVEDCVDLLDAGAAGLLLSDQRGHLHVMASSSEQTRLLELFQLQSDQGPCLECFMTGEAVLAADLSDKAHHWPLFAAEAQRQGFRSVHALPMRLRSETIGALNLFRTQAGPLPDADLQVGQALADVATIGILHHRALVLSEVVGGQLQIALNSRVIIEQAKGVLAEREQLDVDHAFGRLRRYARDNNLALLNVARGVVEGALDLRSAVPEGAAPGDRAGQKRSR
jgi:transcriptional regulator with GAF, ATPase, and Fis domain